MIDTQSAAEAIRLGYVGSTPGRSTEGRDSDSWFTPELTPLVEQLLAYLFDSEDCCCAGGLPPCVLCIAQRVQELMPRSNQE